MPKANTRFTIFKFDDKILSISSVRQPGKKIKKTRDETEAKSKKKNRNTTINKTTTQNNI